MPDCRSLAVTAFAAVRWAGLLLSLLPAPALAVGINLWWDPSPDPTVVGYAVYYGPAGTSAPERQDVGNATSATVRNLQPGVAYFLYLTAYDSAYNESDPSNVIDYTAPAATNSTPAPPLLAVRAAVGGQIHLLLTGQPGSAWDILASGDWLDWKVVGSGSIPGEGVLEWVDPASLAAPARFYRARASGP